MSKWEMVRLGDIASVITKGTTPTTLGFSFQNSGINFIKVESIAQDGKFLPNKLDHITDECNEKLKRSQLKVNDILFSIAGAIGRVAIVSNDILPANINQALAIIRIENTDIDVNYIGLTLKSKSVYKQFQKQKRGVAQLNISLENIANIEIPLMPLDEQMKIVYRLKTATELINLRKQRLAELDNLVKSVFYDMFGDPVTNPMGWKVKQLGDCGSFKNGMNFNQNDSGYRIKCLGVGDFGKLYKIDDVSEISEINLSSEPSQDYLLRDGDIVFVRSNGNRALVGRSVEIFPKSSKLTYSGFCIRYRNESENLLTVYLNQALHLPSSKAALFSSGRGANIQNINQQTLSSLMIPLPPIPLQNRFADFMQSIDSLKFDVKTLIEESQLLFNSLMSQYFE